MLTLGSWHYPRSLTSEKKRDYLGVEYGYG